ncbi:MAG: periplasmic heavy metal sensor [Deltaproteobacteria bacterium]|nr:periplasmic heavy metal sensor [Deltaproteobacteria bacterium]
MKSSALKFLLLVSVSLNIAILGTAGYRYYKNSPYRVFRRGSEHGRYAFLVKELSLSPDQAKVMEEKGRLFHKDIVGAKQQMFQKRMALINLMRSDTPDTKAIDRAISAIGDMQESIQRRIVAHILQVKSFLNRDQQKRFFDMIEKFMARKEDRQGPHDGH